MRKKTHVLVVKVWLGDGGVEIVVEFVVAVGWRWEDVESGRPVLSLRERLVVDDWRELWRR